MASILMQAGAVANGNISVEQASQNAVQIANSVESGQSWASAMGNTLTSSIANLPRSGNATGTSPADATGSFSFSCYTQGLFICTNYTLNSKQRFERFKQQCQQAGSRIVSSCDSNAPSCTESNSSGQQTTFDYTSGSEVVKQKCQASGGRFHNG